MKGLSPDQGYYQYSRLVIFAFLGVLLAPSCTNYVKPPEVNEPVAIFSPTTTSVPFPTTTPTLDKTLLLPSPTPAVQQEPKTIVCSPLEGVSIERLEEHISNPFNPPPPGSDNPHQGVDLADIGAQGAAQAGLQVNAVLAGQVAAVITERFPYGNALLVETRLDRLPAEWLAKLPLPEPGTEPPVRSSLTCPEPSSELVWDRTETSLYLLYAHLQSPPSFVLGEEIGCGQMAGVIGSSGNALNPHLHLELRLGPAGARFASLAHYDASATVDEMAAYCTWRVSGLFGLLDPLSLFLLH